MLAGDEVGFVSQISLQHILRSYPMINDILTKTLFCESDFACSTSLQVHLRTDGSLVKYKQSRHKLVSASRIQSKSKEDQLQVLLCDYIYQNNVWEEIDKSVRIQMIN